MEDNKSMEVFAKAPIRKAALQNALPAMAAMLMVLIYNLADTFFIGQTHDDLQVAAVSLATPVFLLFMSVGTVFGVGGTSVISRALGEGRRDYAKKVCSFCMWCCVAVGVLMSALFLIFMDQILAMIGASAETWDYAKTYLTIVSCSGPFVLIANCYSNVIRAEGQSGKAMMGQLLGNLLNVILDPIMILVFGWNIAGAAIATVIGNVVGAGYYIVYFLKGSSSLSISLKDFSVKEKVASGVLAIGVPAALGNLLMSLSGILMNSQMAKYGDSPNYRRCHAESLGVREMAPCFGSFPFKGDERCFLVALEYNAEVFLILFAFRNRAGHIVVQPHNNLAEADLASRMIFPVIEIAFDVVGTPFHKLFLKVSGPCLHFLIGSRDLYLLGKNNHFSVSPILLKRHRRPGDQNDRQNCAHKCRCPYDRQHLFVELLLRCLANQRGASHADSRSQKCNAQRFP